MINYSTIITEKVKVDPGTCPCDYYLHVDFIQKKIEINFESIWNHEGFS